MCTECQRVARQSFCHLLLKLKIAFLHVYLNIGRWFTSDPFYDRAMGHVFSWATSGPWARPWKCCYLLYCRQKQLLYFCQLIVFAELHLRQIKRLKELFYLRVPDILRSLSNQKPQLLETGFIFVLIHINLLYSISLVYTQGVLDNTSLHYLQYLKGKESKNSHPSCGIYKQSGVLTGTQI